MRRASTSTDDWLLARLQAPPDLSDGVQALAYWHDRRRRLSWYRIRARREAAQMVTRWEPRVRSAMLSQAGVPIGTRASAGLLVTRTHLRRWRRRAVIVLAAMVGITVMLAPAAAAVVAVTRII